MNNHRLSSIESKESKIGVDKDLINFVLNMWDIYIVGS